ncbi:MAG: complex I subunit 1/NuoH family protein [Phycisphaerales bacterium]
MDTILDAIFPIPAQVFVGGIVVLVMVHVILGIIPFLIYLERKISSYIQDRIGPNRVGFDLGLPILQKLFRGFGFWGLGQSLADGIKFLLKEDYAPRGVDKFLFSLAPMAAVVPAFIGWAVIPWGGSLTLENGIEMFGRQIVAPGEALVAVADINVGFVYLLAIASLGVYGVILGGWASNNKYSFLGGLRASAGMISYEIPLGLSILAALLVVGSVRPSVIMDVQASDGWLVLAQPVAALLFFVCILAEANRAPFDNAEAEQELVGGYHTEYSAMRFALFFLAEYAHMITSSAFLILLFFGGYHLPFVPGLQPEDTGLLPAILKIHVFVGKVLLVVCFMMVIRWTLPRIRYDQVMKLAWQSLIPLSIVLVVATSVMVYLGWTNHVAMLAMNVALVVLVLLVQPMLPKDSLNTRVPLAGSRFNPLPGQAVSTRPTDPTALDDDNPMRAGAAGA